MWRRILWNFENLKSTEQDLKRLRHGTTCALQDTVTLDKRQRGRPRHRSVVLLRWPDETRRWETAADWQTQPRSSCWEDQIQMANNTVAECLCRGRAMQRKRFVFDLIRPDIPVDPVAVALRDWLVCSSLVLWTIHALFFFAKMANSCWDCIENKKSCRDDSSLWPAELWIE